MLCLLPVQRVMTDLSLSLSLSPLSLTPSSRQLLQTTRTGTHLSMLFESLHENLSTGVFFFAPRPQEEVLVGGANSPLLLFLLYVRTLLTAL